MQTHTSRRQGRAGFTLVELLTVIGIIAILISILIPVVAAIQRKAREADTSAEIARLATACQNYYNDYRSYPGPVPDRSIYPNMPQPQDKLPGLAVITSSENLVAGLLGAIQAQTDGTFLYQPQFVGQGPQSLNLLNPKQSSPYATFTAKELTEADATGNYNTYNSIAVAKQNIPDGPIPEFMDHFATPNAIIYLRARVGAPNMLSGYNSATAANSQYEPRQLDPYWAALQPSGNYGSFPTYEPAIRYTDPATKKTDYNPSTNVVLYNAPVDFFKHPTINDGRTPRARDSFILISAGADGTFGSKDDIIHAN